MSQTRDWEIETLRASWRADVSLAGKLNRAFDSIGFDRSFVQGVHAVKGKRKYLKDAVWGMVDFDQTAIQLIDSPLLQRLRGVRQLGFSYLVYPSAEHTRFIHSLGMAHVVSSFLASIQRNAGNQIIESEQVVRYRDCSAFAPLTERELIMAALLHDVGHLPFSHASEAALGQEDALFSCGGQPLGAFLTKARYAFGKNISLSEALSILIVLSERFTEFYRQLSGFNDAEATSSLIRIASLIAGIPVIQDCPNIQHLISAAAVDADKIDYVARDAAACGIAVGVDVSRIFMGSGIVEARRDAYDAAYEGDAKGTIFVVNASGADTLDEIVQARSALYQRVYLHPVTRTAEALLSQALRRNATASPQQQRSELTDAIEIWALDDASLLKSIELHPKPEIASLARRPKRRVLPKKACALAGTVAVMHMPLRNLFRRLDPTLANSIKKDIANSYIEKLKREQIKEIGQATLERLIRSEAEVLADALRSGGRGDYVPPKALELVVVTPIAAMDAARPDAIVFQAGELISTPALTNVQGQHDAQDIFRAVGFVFCDPEWRSIVMIATRKVVMQLSVESVSGAVEHEISVGTVALTVGARKRTILDFEGVARRANIARNVAEKTMRAADDVGYFDREPLLYIPTKTDDPDVTAAAAVFKTYVGELGWSVDKVTIAAFVDQFPPKLRKPLLEMLRRGSILDQAALAECLTRAISEARTTEESVVACPLSASSGGEVLTILKNSSIPNLRTCTNLREALRVNGEPLILFVDDNAASGVQASAQLYAHAGVSRAGWPERLAGEDGLYEGELDQSEIIHFKQRRFAIAVAVGLPAAGEALSKTAADLGLERFEGIAFGQQIAEGLEWPLDLKDYLSGVGRELLAHRYTGRSYDEMEDGVLKQRCDERSFGYGSRGGVMATRGNVPSSTVTALWHPGVVNGRPWMPLMIRRGHLKNLVLG